MLYPRIALRKVSASIVEISLRLSKWVVLSVHSHDSQFYYGSHTSIARRRNGRIGRPDTVQSPWIRSHAGSDGEDREKKRRFGYRFRQMEEAGFHIQRWKTAATDWNWLAESRRGKADAASTRVMTSSSVQSVWTETFRIQGNPRFSLYVLQV